MYKNIGSVFSFLPGKGHIQLRTYQAGQLQAKAHRALYSFISNRLTAYGLSLTEWAALGLIYERKAQRPSELADELGVKRPVATGIVNSLAHKGLVERTTHAVDNRVQVLTCLAAGQQLLDTAEQSLRKDMRAFLSDITIPELTTYLKVLAKLAAKL